MEDVLLRKCVHTCGLGATGPQIEQKCISQVSSNLCVLPLVLLPSRLSSPTLQVGNRQICSQSLYRGHNGHILYVSFLSDNTTIVRSVPGGS